MKPFITIVITFILLIIAYSQKEEMLYLIESGERTAIIISFIFVAMLVFFPIIPFAIVAGIIGSVFGVWNGVLISLGGSLMGTMVMFFMARYGFQNWVQKILTKYPKVRDYENAFERNSFIGILLLRLAPIIPAPILNIFCGISMIRWYIFFLATAVGKIPGILILTFAGKLFEQNKLLSIIIYGVYFFLITILIMIRLQKNKIQM